MTTDSTEGQRAARLNITVRPETFARLQEARNRKGIEINVSQVADAAINAELDRRDKPGVAKLIARLRIESDRRRGVFYTHGFQEGLRWASEVGCWAEICGFGTLSEVDVSIEGDGHRRTGPLTFVGSFQPTADYPAAPVFDVEDERVWELDACDQYWRGWLAGVQDVFNSLKDELPPIEPTFWTRGEPPAPRDVDPDEIPF